MRYVCSICGYVYDEAREKLPFSQLPEGWQCPVCKAAKSLFTPEQKEEAPKPAKESDKPEKISLGEEEAEKISAGELAALCSNLARGCEKQYKNQEAVLFRQLADYFTGRVPKVPEADITTLLGLLSEDLKDCYPLLRSAADECSDRGTKRICVWGEKVTNMLNSLLIQYQKEGEAFLSDKEIWVCTVCGFIYVGEQPPEICPVCKVPGWKFEKVEGRDPA